MAFNQLEKKDYMKTSLRVYFLQNGFNYGNYQSLGYTNMLYPALHKMYKDDGDRLQEALGENIEFFNTNIHFLPFIIDPHLVMLRSKTPSNEIRSTKMALMGLLAGIGDPFVRFCLALPFTAINTSLAQDGLTISPILFFVAMNVVLLTMKLLIDTWGYKPGTNIIATLSTKMERVSNTTSMIGVTVVSGLVVNLVKISTPTQHVANIPGNQQEVVAIQEMIDAIAPKLLPVLLIGLIFYLIEMKRWITYKLVILTIILGVVSSVLSLIV